MYETFNSNFDTTQPNQSGIGFNIAFNIIDDATFAAVPGL